MIKVEVWLDGIIGTAELIATEHLFERVWLKGDKSITSITEPYELFEQVFDGLDADEFVKSREFKLIVDEPLRMKVASFLHALHILDNYVDEQHLDDNPKAVLESAEWESLKSTAKCLAVPYKNMLINEKNCKE